MEERRKKKEERGKEKEEMGKIGYNKCKTGKNMTQRALLESENEVSREGVIYNFREGGG
jgi:hypothetical protein